MTIFRLLRRLLERLEASMLSLATRDPEVVHHLDGALDMAVAARLTAATGEVLWNSFVLHEAMRHPESAMVPGRRHPEADAASGDGQARVASTSRGAALSR